MNRKPRQGELNYEIERVLNKHKDERSMTKVVSSVQREMSKVAKAFNVKEFHVKYDRDVDTRSGINWVVENVEIVMYRVRPNRTLAIHRAGLSRYPANSKTNEMIADLKAKRSRHVYSFVDEEYSWRELTIKSPRASLVKKWNSKKNR